MKNRNSRRGWRELCAEPRDGDGIDPRIEDRKSRAGDGARDHSLRQLCRQVRDVVQLTLAGCADDALRGLMVIAVVPQPDATRLLVEVASASNDPQADCLRIEQALARANGYLRAETATALVRKRAPELAFRWRPAAEVSR